MTEKTLFSKVIDDLVAQAQEIANQIETLPLEDQGYSILEVDSEGRLEDWCGCAGPMTIKVVKE